MKICVYGAASPTIDPYYIEKVEALGETLVNRGHSLVFGGGANGLMGAVARGVHKAEGHIVGIIPKFFNDEKIEAVCEFCDEFIEPDTMRERKSLMEEKADAFIVVPGGIGTFEEFFEILTLKQLCRHKKPIAIYNLQGYYNEILKALDTSVEKGFVKDNCLDLYMVTENIDELFSYIENDPTNSYTVKELKKG